jgi:hypothetical protein
LSAGICFLADTQLQQGEGMSDELPVQSGSAGLVDRAKNILMQPKPEWTRIAGETAEPMKVFTTYALPLLLIGPIATFIGSQVFGTNAIIATYRPTIGFSLTIAITSIVLAVIQLFVIAFAANFLSKQFGGKESFSAAFRLVAYSMTAAWLAGIFGIVPMLAILSIVGLYSFYLFYLGATPVMGVPEDKAVAYTVVTVLVVIVAYVVISVVVSGLIIGGLVGVAGLASPGI